MASKKPEASFDARPIKTLYYRDSTLLRVNQGTWYTNAVKNCTGHMHQNRYGATSAEILDGSKANELLAVVTHSVIGKIEIIYEKEPKTGEK